MVSMVSGAVAQPWKVASPDEKLVISVKQDTVAAISANQKNCYFQVQLSGTTVLDWSPLGLTTNDQNFVNGLTFVKEATAIVNETYTLPSGKRSTYVNNCNELALTFSNAGGRQVVFYLRAYKDAAAFRYELSGSGTAQVTGEVSGFTLPSGTIGWGHILPNDERTYDQFTVGAAAVSYGIPVLFKTTADAWVLITEAAVYGDYTGTHFASKSATKNVFQTTFPAGQGAISGAMPWKLPWRVAIIGNGPGPVIESSVVEHLNPPCELADVSWVKSGRSAWSWLSQETGDMTQQKRYIDFASQMGWEYNLIDWNYDKTKVTETCQYGTQKNVGNELWYNYTDVKTQAQQSSVFGQCKTWGVKGLKIDFIFDNGNENTSYNNTLMKWFDMTCANLAANKLMVTFHGCTVPRGQRRRWPHIMTYEGVLGYEYIGRGYPGTKHDCTLPFTRNVIGPMDHTPVLFTTGQLTNGSGATRTSTDAHELALSVIYESGLQHFADRPEGYNGFVGKSFLQTVPSAWDDIHFIDGYPGQNVILARRKGNDWYVAGISAEAAKTMQVSLSFLKDGTYTVDLYKDSTGTQRTAAKQTVTVTPSSPLSVWVNTNGGFGFKVPNSYQPPVAVVPERSAAVAQSMVAGQNDQYRVHQVVGKTAGGTGMLKSDRIINLQGRTIPQKGTSLVPQGAYIPVRAK
jgi:alpha-glucosidase